MLKSLMHDPAKFKYIVRYIHKRMLKLVAKIRPTEKARDIQVHTSTQVSLLLAPADPLLEQWMSTNKNSSQLRELIIGMTLDVLQRLRLKHHPSTMPEQS